jgi:hypothetical protein
LYHIFCRRGSGGGAGSGFVLEQQESLLLVV